MSKIEKRVKYWPNGPKKWGKTYKNGELDGLRTRWYENGQKWKEGTYKDGERDGLWTEWYINGQKRLEATWKDGALISIQNWNKDGNLIGINAFGMSMDKYWKLRF